MKGKNLREIRESKNLMQKEVAEISEVSRPFYSLLERGKRIPSMNTAKRIANTLGLTLDEFFEALNLTVLGD